ncbi:MAG TPA: succinate--CoA ligase subunit alpha [Thermoprotei archaeon]|nr:succinate--CoA ligase subunit alpha [Thermoprotei archaeon]
MLPGFIDRDIRLLVQGITGRQGRFHTEQMLKYGTKIVAGVTPGKGGSEVHGVPVYDNIYEAVKAEDPTASIIFVPARYAFEAVYEAIQYNLDPIVVITEGIPAHDTLRFINLAKAKNIKIIGPNTPGFILPGYSKVGIMPNQYFRKGNISIISRSGTLTYEVSKNILDAGLGQRLVVGCGGDYVIGTSFIDLLPILEKDDETDAIVIIGEIGGDDEERAAEYIGKSRIDKPIIVYIAGRSAPEGKRMGHAGAIISGSSGSAEGKIESFKKAGAYIAYRPIEIVEILKEVL